MHTPSFYPSNSTVKQKFMSATVKKAGDLSKDSRDSRTPTLALKPN